MELEKVAAGTDLVKQGQVGAFYYGICSGECEVQVNDKKVATLGAGQVSPSSKSRLFLQERSLMVAFE